MSTPPRLSTPLPGRQIRGSISRDVAINYRVARIGTVLFLLLACLAYQAAGRAHPGENPPPGQARRRGLWSRDLKQPLHDHRASNGGRPIRRILDTAEGEGRPANRQEPDNAQGEATGRNSNAGHDNGIARMQLAKVRKLHGGAQLTVMQQRTADSSSARSSSSDSEGGDIDGAPSTSAKGSGSPGSSRPGYYGYGVKYDPDDPDSWTLDGSSGVLQFTALAPIGDVLKGFQVLRIQSAKPQPPSKEVVGDKLLQSSYFTAVAEELGERLGIPPEWILFGNPRTPRTIVDVQILLPAGMPEEERTEIKRRLEELQYNPLDVPFGVEPPIYESTIDGTDLFLPPGYEPPPLPPWATSSPPRPPDPKQRPAAPPTGSSGKGKGPGGRPWWTPGSWKRPPSKDPAPSPPRPKPQKPGRPGKGTTSLPDSASGPPPGPVWRPGGSLPSSGQPPSLPLEIKPPSSENVPPGGSDKAPLGGQPPSEPSGVPPDRGPTAPAPSMATEGSGGRPAAEGGPLDPAQGVDGIPPPTTPGQTATSTPQPGSPPGRPAAGGDDSAGSTAKEQDGSTAPPRGDREHGLVPPGERDSPTGSTDSSSPGTDSGSLSPQLPGSVDWPGEPAGPTAGEGQGSQVGVSDGGGMPADQSGSTTPPGVARPPGPASEHGAGPSDDQAGPSHGQGQGGGTGSGKPGDQGESAEGGNAQGPATGSMAPPAAGESPDAQTPAGQIGAGVGAGTPEDSQGGVPTPGGPRPPGPLPGDGSAGSGEEGSPASSISPPTGGSSLAPPPSGSPVGDTDGNQRAPTLPTDQPQPPGPVLEGGASGEGQPKDIPAGSTSPPVAGGSPNEHTLGSPEAGGDANIAPARDPGGSTVPDGRPQPAGPSPEDGSGANDENGRPAGGSSQPPVAGPSPDKEPPNAPAGGAEDGKGVPGDQSGPPGPVGGHQPSVLSDGGGASPGFEGGGSAGSISPPEEAGGSSDRQPSGSPAGGDASTGVPGDSSVSTPANSEPRPPGSEPGRDPAPEADRGTPAGSPVARPGSLGQGDGTGTPADESPPATPAGPAAGSGAGSGGQEGGSAGPKPPPPGAGGPVPLRPPNSPGAGDANKDPAEQSDPATSGPAGPASGSKGVNTPGSQDPEEVSTGPSAPATDDEGKEGPGPGPSPDAGEASPDELLQAPQGGRGLVDMNLSQARGPQDDNVKPGTGGDEDSFPWMLVLVTTAGAVLILCIFAALLARRRRNSAGRSSNAAASQPKAVVASKVSAGENTVATGEDGPPGHGAMTAQEQLAALFLMSDKALRKTAGAAAAAIPTPGGSVQPVSVVAFCPPAGPVIREEDFLPPQAMERSQSDTRMDDEFEDVHEVVGSRIP